MKKLDTSKDTGGVVGKIPYRLALAGGWIDQPFVSRHNPSPPGSMVVVSLEPLVRFMERSGLATGTRKVAMRLWNGELPIGSPEKLVRQLYYEENKNLTDPSGSQDMIGLVYPGICRLDYDFGHEGGVFPCHVESTEDPETVNWLEDRIQLIAVAPRPDGYDPLGTRNLAGDWIRRLGRSGRECFEGIVNRDIERLGGALNECMKCWQAILPATVDHPTLTVDLLDLLHYYQDRYAGAMYSGCGGGYLIVLSDDPVPGAFEIKVRTSG